MSGEAKSGALTITLSGEGAQRVFDALVRFAAPDGGPAVDGGRTAGSEGAETEPGLYAIVSAAAKEWGVRYDAILEKNNLGRIAEARQAAMYLARKLTSASLPGLGRFFFRTHCTVLHAVRVAKGRMEVDAKFRARVERAERAAVSG